MAKAKTKRPKPRPVLQFRVHPELYKDLTREAKKLGISISHEAELRIIRGMNNKERESIYAEFVSRIKPN
jgi:hypothetical protein